MSVTGTQLDWGGMAPFLLLTATALGTLLLDLFLSPRHRVRLAYLGLTGLLITMALLVHGFGGQERVVAEMLIVDDFSRFFHLVFLLIAALTILVSVKSVEQEGTHQGEYYALVLFATLGMMVMASAADLIMVFLGLEALSIPLYILSGFLHVKRIWQGVRWLSFFRFFDDEKAHLGRDDVAVLADLEFQSDGV